MRPRDTSSRIARRVFRPLADGASPLCTALTARVAGLAGLVLVLFGTPALAEARNPCSVATAPAAGCNDIDCALDPDTELTGSWQRLTNCIMPLRRSWAREGGQALFEVDGQPQRIADIARNVIYRALTQGGAGATLESEPTRYRPLSEVLAPDLSLRRPVVLIAQLNTRGEPYNGMSQTSLARILFGFSALATRGGYPQAQADAAAYDRLGRATLATVLTPVDQGGLASTAACAQAPALRCTWFHSVTRPDREPRQGATLNQDLHVIRDLFLVQETLRSAGQVPDPAYQQAISAGLNQLFLSGGHSRPGQPPDLANFLATPGSGASWAYYGLNPDVAPPGGGYFLNEPGRNCSYHYHVLDLMAAILDGAGRANLAPQARQAALACGSPLHQMYRAATLNLPVPSVASGKAAQGAWCSVRPNRKSEQRMSLLSNAYARCAP